MVYVLNKDEQPFMPTDRHGKVKHLLKSKVLEIAGSNPAELTIKNKIC